ncbi:hypothetical protein L1987_58329 [Smallanthus sonchifolius]|uniref:Uncharacterized protein n=1 Tax=Smallanthus sonchifolius TaxID=185202 RepID=A0ACB9DFI4_9ASTR|nr:hypothetical protein L1987_58329 [Smallanthus sonchifolius]
MNNQDKCRTLNMLGLAKRVGARMLLASTSEVYGDPLVHPLVHPRDESYREMLTHCSQKISPFCCFTMMVEQVNGMSLNGQTGLYMSVFSSKLNGNLCIAIKQIILIIYSRY